jgi:hypothetical protein
VKKKAANLDAAMPRFASSAARTARDPVDSLMAVSDPSFQ